MRKFTSILTGIVFLLQTLLLPLANSAQSPRSSSNQKTQTGNKSLVRICIPLDLVKNEFWEYPYPGSEIADFKTLIGNYILAHGDPHVKYRIKDQAFEIFKSARRASAPYAPDPRNLLEEVNAEQSCPPNNSVNTLEVPPHDSPADVPPMLDPLAPVAAGIALLALTQNGDVALKCDQLAASPDDPQKSGPGVRLDQIRTSEAHPVCEQAATRHPSQARYQLLYGRVLEAEGNLGEAAKWYLKAGNSGLADAYAAMASLYARGNPPNYVEALKWSEKAAQGGSGLGSTQLGWHYQFGQGVPKDLSHAVQLYTAAAQKGNMQGLYFLGLLYLLGQGVSQDYTAAANLFQQAAQQGNADAQDQLGNLYLRGRGVPANYQTAFSWFIRSAEAGKADAQFWVAAMYDNGQGVSQDKSLAVAWYRKAAGQGDPYAMTQLGYHLRAGEGVAWSEREAMQWLRRASDKGDADAQTGLGWGYMQGLGQDQGQGVQDYRQAFYWLSQAASQKDAGVAQLNLGVLYQKGWGVDQDLDKANQLFRLASRSPYPEIANAARTYVRNNQVATTQASSKDTDALLGLAVLALGVLAVGTLVSGPSSSSRDPGPSTGTTSDTSNSNDNSTQILRDHFASENAARDAAAAERQADRDNWARTQRCGFNANVNCF